MLKYINVFQWYIDDIAMYFKKTLMYVDIFK
jgi:hypothetical protein